MSRGGSRRGAPHPDVTTYTVMSYFLPAIINGDRSGLTEHEDRQLTAFISLPEHDLRNGHWAIIDGEETRFDDCEICGGRGDCRTVGFVDMRPVREAAANGK